jgi:HTH-type transcriptional regulator/antitoxin MqsA
MCDSNNGCPICGEGNLQPKAGNNLVEYKGQSAEITFLYSVCNTCGSEQSNAAQLRDNKRAMVAFKKKVDGLLTGAEVRALRERLCLSQAEAAEVFGGGPVAFSKYESDDVTQSEAMDKLLRVAVEEQTAFSFLAKRAGIQRVIDAPYWQEMNAVEAVPQEAKKTTRLRVVSSSNPEPEENLRYAA